MKVMMADCLIKTDSHYMMPFLRYVVSDFEADQLVARTTRVRWTVSSFNSYERRYGGQDLNGKSVCIYRHSAWGDQLIASAVPRFLKAQFPQAKIHLFSHASVHSLWDGNPFVEGSALPLPIPFDAVVRGYDYHVFYEGMLEGNSEPDQNNCYDDMFAFIGFRDVPYGYKRPHIERRPEDYLFVRQKLGWSYRKPYVLYHMSPANPNRCYPFNLAFELIAEIPKRFPSQRVVVVGTTDRHNKAHQEREQDFRGKLAMLSHVEDLVDKLPAFRDMIPLVEEASAVICPDSSVLHLAATVPGVPVLGLWGLFDWRDRAKYYPNHIPLAGEEGACPFAPCRDHNFFLPEEKCKQSELFKAYHGAYCSSLASISPEKILAALGRVL